MATIKRSLATLHERAKDKRTGYVEDVLAQADRVDGEHYWIDEARYLALRRKWASPPKADSADPASPEQPLAPESVPARPQSARTRRHPSRLRQAANLTRAAAHAAGSVAKTSLGIDRASDELIDARLDVCRQCPGDHATWKNGDVHTCGPMVESAVRAGDGTCGCILRAKARDAAENCPFGYWPDPPGQLSPG